MANKSNQPSWFPLEYGRSNKYKAQLQEVSQSPSVPHKITKSVGNELGILEERKPREVRISWYQLFSVVYFRAFPPPQKETVRGRAPSWGTGEKPRALRKFPPAASAHKGTTTSAMTTGIASEAWRHPKRAISAAKSGGKTIPETPRPLES